MAKNLSSHGMAMLDHYIADKAFRDAVHADPTSVAEFASLSAQEQAALKKANREWKHANLSDADRVTITQGKKAGAQPYALFW